MARARMQALLTSCAGRGVVLCLALVLAACGGGGGGSSNSAAAAANFPASIASVNDANVATISVEPGPGNNVNIPYVTVTVCSPGGVLGSSSCKVIDHVLLDTGSTGLRLFANAINAPPSLALPAHKIGNSSTITECAQFLNSLAWGSIQVADVVIGENAGAKRAASVPIQIMDTNYPTALNAVCGGSPLMAQSTSRISNWELLSANGILGVSLFANDGQHYFNCAPPITTRCQISPQAAVALQVQNPVIHFTGDNNGVVVQLPPIATSGAPSAKGYLIFGVGTQPNNALGLANVVPVNASTGYFTTLLQGRTLGKSFFDSGSNGLFFNDPSANSLLSTNCSTAAAGFYCPTLSQDLSANVQLASASVVVNFTIANADQLFKASNYAFNSIGGTMADNRSFDWGLPFFFGRSVYTVIEGTTVGALNGPFYAFTNPVQGSGP
jgi:hypothetical protein